MMKKNDKSIFTHLAISAGIFAAGVAYSNNSHNQSKVSRAEKDDPDFVEEVYEVVSETLDQWSPIDCETEDDFTNDLFEYLADNIDYEIEMYPSTRFGKPDILIGGALVLELKVNPNKSERDRLIGQCAGYSREWATWAVLINTPRSAFDEVERLLSDKGLEHILVWGF
jgi:hypothetical protein